MPPFLPLPPRTASVSDLLEAATRLFRVTLLKCLPFTLLAVLFALLPNIYWIATGHTLGYTLGSALPRDPGYLLLCFVGMIAFLLLASIAMLRQRALIRGETVRAASELSAALPRLPVLALAWILANLSVAAGFLLLLLPGIFLGVCYGVLGPVVLFDGVGPYAALVRCVTLVRPFWWRACAAIVIALLIATVCAIVMVSIISVIAELLAPEAAARALAAAAMLGAEALIILFLSALGLVLYSAASSSA
ncbi:MAG: hypothetical protein ACHQAR_04540 [Steroidobacterales bacterium]